MNVHWEWITATIMLNVSTPWVVSGANVILVILEMVLFVMVSLLKQLHNSFGMLQ